MSNANDTPAVTPEALAELQKQNDQLKAAQAEKDRVISDLNATNATLEARMAGTAPKEVAPNVAVDDAAIDAEAQAILEEGQTDPATAAKKLGRLIKKVSDSTAQAVAERVTSQIQPQIENQKFAETIRNENKDILEIDPGFEQIIANEANALMSTKPKSQQTMVEFQKTVREVVAAKRVKLAKFLKPQEPAPKVPAGAQGEDGNGKPVQTTPATAKTEADNSAPDARLATARNKGLF